MTRRLPIMLVALLLAGACANQAAARDAILSRTIAGLNAAHVAFVEADAARQAGIVAAAKSLEEGKTALAEYRGKRDKVAAAFVAAYGAVAVASLDLTDQAIVHVVTLAGSVITAMRELGLLPSGSGGAT